MIMINNDHMMQMDRYWFLTHSSSEFGSLFCHTFLPNAACSRHCFAAQAQQIVLGAYPTSHLKMHAVCYDSRDNDADNDAHCRLLKFTL